MTIYKPAFFRPIEIQSSSNAWKRVTYDVQGGATTAIDIATGVYSSIPALLYALTQAAIPVGNNVQWFLVDSSGDLRIRCTGTTAMKVLAETELEDIIGDPLNAMNVSYATTQTCPYAPEYTWIPTHQNALQDRFHLDHKKAGAGSISQTGEIVGNRLGPDIYFRRLKFTNEEATNIFNEAATIEYHNTRNVDAFVLGSMWSAPIESGNPSTRGFFFYPDWNDAIDYAAFMPGGTTGINTSRLGINYDYSSNHDMFTFCQFDSSPFDPGKASFQYGRRFYEIEFEIHTVDAMPTWEAPSQ
jgi:hypothetical protein